MRTATGQAFLCALPPVSEAKPIKKPPPSSELTATDEEQRKDKMQRERDGLKNGLALLESLKDRCIYTRSGWFTYSFC